MVGQCLLALPCDLKRVLSFAKASKEEVYIFISVVGNELCAIYPNKLGTVQIWVTMHDFFYHREHREHRVHRDFSYLCELCVLCGKKNMAIVLP